MKKSYGGRRAGAGRPNEGKSGVAITLSANRHTSEQLRDLSYWLRLSKSEIVRRAVDEAWNRAIEMRAALKDRS